MYLDYLDSFYKLLNKIYLVVLKNQLITVYLFKQLLFHYV